jgi:hypothetical protein
MRPRSRAWCSVATQYGEGQALAVGLHAEEGTNLSFVERPAPEPDVGVGENVCPDIRAAGGDHMLGAPALRSADLEHTLARLEQSEQQPERMLVGLPREVVPSAVPREVRQRGVDLVIRLVPPLIAGHRRPPVGLTRFLRDARNGLVQHAGNAIAHVVGAPAGRARQHLVAADRSVTGRAPEELEPRRRGDDAHRCSA